MPGLKPCPATETCEPFETGSGVTQHFSDPVVRLGPPLSVFGAAASCAVSSVLIASMAKTRHTDLVHFAVCMCSPSFATTFSPGLDGPGGRHDRGLQVPRHRDARRAQQAKWLRNSLLGNCVRRYDAA